MLTLQALRGQIDEALNVNSDDSVFDYRLYDDLIFQKREKWLSVDYEKTKRFDELYIQSFCMDLEEVDSNLCCNLGFTSGCKVLRTKQELPLPISLKTGDGIIDIKPANLFSMSFTKIDFSRVATIRNSRWANTAIYVWRYNNRLYFYSKNDKFLLIEKVLVRSVLYNPLEASLLGCESDCSSDTDAFPISGRLWDTFVKPDIVQDLLGRYRLPKDESNDARDRDVVFQDRKNERSNINNNEQEQ
ncbi:MAG TPA: hypothetical protein VIK77_02855 [Tissierellaceae bacterium]